MKLTLQIAREALRPADMIISKTEYGEYRVNFPKGDEKDAYYTTDLKDAVGTGWAMRERAVKKNPRAYPGQDYTGDEEDEFDWGETGGEGRGMRKRYRRNPGFDSIQHGDTVHYFQYAGMGRSGAEYKRARGKAVMLGPHGWVINIGGRYGTPAIVSRDNYIKGGTKSTRKNPRRKYSRKSRSRRRYSRRKK